MKTDLGIHENSVTAYREEEPRLSARAGAILAWLHVHGASTDRQVMQGMGFEDMNSVRPRISELLFRGEIEEVGSRKCHYTGKTVRVVDAKRGQGALFQ